MQDFYLKSPEATVLEGPQATILEPRQGGAVLKR
jgi:hypothetical protein